jgi:hypothetical protein
MGASPVFTGLTVSDLTAKSFLYSGSGGKLITTTSPTNGQLLIGSTEADPVKATITAGNGIMITNGAGSITIANNIPVAQAISAINVTTESTSYVVATGMTITPGAGDYLVFFTSSIASSSNKKTVFVSLFKNGIQIPASEIKFLTAASDAIAPVVTSAYVPGILAGETIDVRWKVSANTGTMYQRTLIAQKVK